MLTRIVRPSPELAAFLNRLGPALSEPQRQHLLRLADALLVDALLVCEDRKTPLPGRVTGLTASDLSAAISASRKALSARGL
jgi:hypothetical protein